MVAWSLADLNFEVITLMILRLFPNLFSFHFWSCFGNEHLRISCHFISVGDTIDVRGPGGLLMYEGRGAFELKEDKKAAPKQVKVRNDCRSSVPKKPPQAKPVLFTELLPRQNK